MNKKGKVLFLLRQREYFVPSYFRNDLKVVRALVCQKGAKFKKISEKHTKHPIAYEGGRLYFENYRVCYTPWGSNGGPSILYHLPHVSNDKKIQDGLICQCVLDTVPREYLGHRESFMALTADNWLVRQDLSTGRVLQQVYLSARHKFRHISWERDNESFVVRSIHNKMSALAREAGIIQTVMMVLAVFKVFPLEFVGMFEVSRAIFGKDVTDATISQGLLITMHQGGLTKLYSFDHILEQFRLYTPSLHEHCHDTEDIIGSYPGGLPFNIQITECPPVLFQIRCDEHSVHLGGIPWHYIICPYGSRGHFQVFDLNTRQMAIEGDLDFGTMTVEPDKCIFHGDDSGRILHVGANEIRVLSLRDSADSSRQKVCEDFTIKVPRKTKQTRSPADAVSFTSSGRVVRKRFCYSDFDETIEGDYETIQAVDYENELDLLAVTSVHQDEDCFRATVHLHDNQTGELAQEFPLEEIWREFYEHVLTVDLDTVIHISKGPVRKISCHMYRLDRRIDDDVDIGSRETKESNPRSKGEGHEEWSSTSRSRTNRSRRHITRSRVT